MFPYFCAIFKLCMFWLLSESAAYSTWFILCSVFIFGRVLESISSSTSQSRHAPRLFHLAYQLKWPRWWLRFRKNHLPWHRDSAIWDNRAGSKRFPDMSELPYTKNCYSHDAACEDVLLTEDPFNHRVPGFRITSCNIGLSVVIK